MEEASKAYSVIYTLEWVTETNLESSNSELSIKISTRMQYFWFPALYQSTG